MSFPDSTATAPEQRWSAFTRVGFRLLFCYFAQYLCCCGNVTLWTALPTFGGSIEFLLAEPYRVAGRWLAVHFFHLHGASALIHASRTTDKANDYLAALVMLLVAVLVTAIWTAVESARQRDRRAEYETLWLWLRFALRLTLGLSMLTYSFVKIYPIQFPTPSLAVLNEPLGNVSPMTLLWSLLGSNHTYELVCGITEAAGGLLLFWRRTALAGALFSAFVLSNVVLYNLFFDVPVKLYAMHILAMAVLIAAPDFPALFRFFWLHQTVVTGGGWVPPSPFQGRHGRAFKRAILAVELLVVVMAAIVIPHGDAQFYARERKVLAHPSALVGQWHLDRAVVPGPAVAAGAAAATMLPRPFLNSGGLPLSDLFLEPDGRTNVRSTDGRLWRGGHYNPSTQTLFINSPKPVPVYYRAHQPDPNHLILTPTTAAEARTYPEMFFSRVPLPQHYALFERGYHFINEWGYEH